MLRSILFCRKLVLVLTSLALAGPAAAITLGQVDDFQADKGNWLPANAVRQANGGPSGDGDSFFKYTSTGTAGRDNRLVVLNDVQWAGDYLGAGVTTIALDVTNRGDTNLDLRLSIGSPSDTSSGSMPVEDGTWYTTTTAISIPAGSADWLRVEFDLTDADMVAVEGSDSLADVLAGVTQIRFLSSAVPSNRGDSISAIIGIDNVTAVPEPSTAALMTLGLVGLVAARRRHA